MILLIHIVIALTSIVSTTALAARPSAAKLRLSYALIALTLASGTYLVLSMHASLLSSCVTGLVYLGVAMSGVGVAYYRLAAEKQTNR